MPTPRPALWLPLLVLLLLSACSDPPPAVKLGDDQAYLFGVWLHQSNAYGSDVNVDYRMLVFYPDSSAIYKRCSKAPGSSKSVNLGKSYISKLTDTELVLTTNLFITTIETEFVINRPAWQEDSDWLMEIDGVVYRRLKPGEQTNHESWPCEKSNNDDVI